MPTDLSERSAGVPRRTDARGTQRRRRHGAPLVGATCGRADNKHQRVHPTKLGVPQATRGYCSRSMLLREGADETAKSSNAYTP